MFPEKISLGQLNTPIYKLEKISEKLGKNIYIKRDDLTGIELSGNKVRKLEYCLKEALNLGANVIITCGAVQSNHARATVVAARKLNLDIHLVLRGNAPEIYTGNILIDKIMDAKVTYLDADEFNKHEEVMASLKKQYEQSGQKAYIIPIGASNGIGNFGYYNAYQEILTQERELQVCFDTIVCAVGSGGTYSGLYLGNHFNNYAKKLVGYSVGGSSDYFKTQSIKILNESLQLLKKLGEKNMSALIDAHMIVDDFQESGYAQTSAESIQFIKYIARTEGLILDPVYTGKAFKGLYTQIQKGEFNESDNILYIHTGGIFGIEPFQSLF